MGQLPPRALGDDAEVLRGVQFRVAVGAPHERLLLYGKERGWVMVDREVADD